MGFLYCFMSIRTLDYFVLFCFVCFYIYLKALWYTERNYITCQEPTLPPDSFNILTRVTGEFSVTLYSIEILAFSTLFTLECMIIFAET